MHKPAELSGQHFIDDRLRPWASRPIRDQSCATVTLWVAGTDRLCR